MGLSSKDARPSKIDPQDAYDSIYAHCHKVFEQTKPLIAEKHHARLQGMLDHIPVPGNLNPDELHGLFNQVIMGALEWSYHESDGQFKMGAYAHEGLASLGRDYQLPADVRRICEQKPWWPFTNLK